MNQFKKSSHSEPTMWENWPHVTMIIAAHNEEKVIAQKLTNTLNLDYPLEKLQIIVAADGCTDRTIEIVQSFAEQGIELFEQPEHLGKTSALNQSVQRTRDKFVVFSDANGMYQPQALKELIKYFTFETIGCVCGNLILTNPQAKSVGEGEGLYWRYEKWIKQQESQFHSLIGANGSIFAIRRELYTPLDSDIIDDFTTPLLIYRQGYRVVYEQNAQSIEEANEDASQGFSRKVRIILRQLVALKRYVDKIHPFSGILGFQLVSHKFLRWIVPFFMIGIFLSTLFILHSVEGMSLMIGQVLFYGTALIGCWQDRKNKNVGKFKVPYYFCMMNLAALIAIIKFLCGKTQPKWKVAR